MRIPQKDQNTMRPEGGLQPVATAPRDSNPRATTASDLERPAHNFLRQLQAYASDIYQATGHARRSLPAVRKGLLLTACVATALLPTAMGAQHSHRRRTQVEAGMDGGWGSNADATQAAIATTGVAVGALVGGPIGAAIGGLAGLGAWGVRKWIWG